MNNQSSMNLTDLFSPQFSTRIKKEGQSYFNSGRVRLNRRDTGAVEFFVVGETLFRVRLQRTTDASLLNFNCTCSYFKSGHQCKHIWAGLLEAERRILFPKLQVLEPSPESAPTPEVNDEPEWKRLLTKLHPVDFPQGSDKIYYAADGVLKTIFFVFDIHQSMRRQKIYLSFYERDYLKSGELGDLKACEMSQELISLYSDPFDQEILWSLLGQTEKDTFHYTQRSSGIYLTDVFAQDILQRLAEAKKLYVLKATPEQPAVAGSRREEPELYHFKNEEWNFKLVLKEVADSYFLRPAISNGHENRSMHDVLGYAGGLVCFQNFAAPSNLYRFESWIQAFKRRRETEITTAEMNDFLAYYYADSYRPALQLPESLQFQDSKETPTVRIEFYRSDKLTRIGVKIEFIYHGHVIHFRSELKEILEIEKRRKIVRDLGFEKNVTQVFASFLLGEKSQIRETAGDFFISESSLYPLVEKCLEQGWQVIADQHKLTVGKTIDVQVSSGLNWFHLEADFSFGNSKISLPQLLKSLRSGKRIIQLPDGTSGVLPEAWMKRFGPLAAMAQESETGLRLTHVQALFFAGGMTEHEKIKGDKGYQTLKRLIDEIGHLQPHSPSESFQGSLRHYQEEGVSWLETLGKHQIGAVLADDMGLGKTVQVLALLSGENDRQKQKLPSLIVAPKSLVFNWMNEAQKFTPHLKVLNYTGPERRKEWDGSKSVDLILTTYQTLRSDIEFIGTHKFGYLILDEAQFIKNSKSLSFAACLQVQAQKKIALTGTPVENSVNDLFSILSVVTPGLLSPPQAAQWAQEKDPKALQGLARALKPFILRRTKEQVLKELPEKSEQILFCELSEPEKQKYDQLKQYYWSQLSDHVENNGLGKSKMMILEALLRLRQAACHQGLLDQNRKAEASSKFELLLDQIETVIRDGHKALIFSQFTSLLALLKPHLESRNINFQYLDGQTQDRSSRVEEFQTDPNVSLFLLSLKAGGVGLNLTAADYVFILDPWWNPAVESQAIDRTHRIGQDKKVFAYKIIAKNTIEEKILELQKSKKKLADIVVSEQASLLKGMSLEDLKVLFE